MRRHLTLWTCMAGAVTRLMAQDAPEPTAAKPADTKEPATVTIVIIETNHGAIKAELFADKAPLTVANFLAYTDKGHYDGTIFHRVIDNFMIQGGGFTPDMAQKPTDAPIRNEARGDVPNVRGTLAMARTGVIDSATNQFFINLKDNAFLNHTAKTPQGFGYAVFGRVIEGLEVVDKIAKVATTRKGAHENVPVEPVVIRSVKRAAAP